MKGRGKDARRLADFVFKMAECSMADDYAIFKKEHRPVCFTNFEGKVVFPHPVCQEGSNFRIPVHSIYMCRCALKNEEYNNSCYSYSMRC